MKEGTCFRCREKRHTANKCSEGQGNRPKHVARVQFPNLLNPLSHLNDLKLPSHLNHMINPGYLVHLNHPISSRGIKKSYPLEQGDKEKDPLVPSHLELFITFGDMNRKKSKTLIDPGLELNHISAEFCEKEWNKTEA